MGKRDFISGAVLTVIVSLCPGLRGTAGERLPQVRLWPHTRFVEMQLADATDRHDELFFAKEILVSRNEAPITNAAPVVCLENTLTGEGFACLRVGPLPYVRTDKRPDYVLDAGHDRLILLSNDYPCVTRTYAGGRVGRIRALQEMQRELRPYVSGRDGLFLSNTWGDGNRDACINEAFLMKEVEAGAALGIDVIQIDDGWQKGRSANSAALTKGEKGRWGSWWDIEGFWDVDPVRFPNGIDPVVAAAKAKGMKFGLWFGPDSTDEAKAWERDAEFLLSMHRRHGIDYFKLDSMKTLTPLALARQAKLMDRIIGGSEGKVTIDLDVTAGVRPGYFGFPKIGPVFVENRYIRRGEKRLWWPHRTLRNLWSLAQAVDPVRLRMEVLNPCRMPELYPADDPLAPARWPADAIFAISMFASPLGWFEIQNLKPETVAAWKPLIAQWKRERDAIHSGYVYPVGSRPDGLAWTGFVAGAKDGKSGSALLFRELSENGEFSLDLSGMIDAKGLTATVIGGRGTAVLEGGTLKVSVKDRLDFIWVRLARQGGAPDLQGLTRLKFNNPGERTYLKVGLWGWPMVMDYDGDGDLDLVVGCGDVAYGGTHFFENPGGGAMPVFRKGIRIAGKMGNVARGTSTGNGCDDICVPGARVIDFAKSGYAKTERFGGLPANVHSNAVRGNVWRMVDFDGDGRRDVVVGIGDWTCYKAIWQGKQENYAKDGTWLTPPVDGLVYWCRNNGKGYDRAALVRLADGNPLWVNGNPMPMCEDWDGDGDLDILCGEFVDGFTYFENVGTRTAPKYAAGRLLSAAQGGELRMELAMMTPSAVDWDGDGRLDVICGDEDGRVAFIRNTGRLREGMPLFERPRYFRQEADEVNFGCLSTPCGVDWDGDGDWDLISGDSAGHIAFIENLSGPHVAEPKWAEPVRLAAGGKEILIQAGEKGSIQGPIERKWGYTCLTVADWDGDGLPDIMANSIWGDVIWFRNVGTRAKPVLAAAEDVEVDWRGDQPEMPFGWYQPKHKRNPKGLLTQWRTTPVMFDWNGDGLMDLVMLDKAGYLALYRRERRDGRLVLLPPERVFADEKGELLRPAPRNHGASGRRKLTLADWNGDGRPDLVMNSRNAEVWINLGTDGGVTRFRKSGDVAGYRLAGHTSAPTPVDFDGDGMMDLVIGAEDGFFYYVRNPHGGF